MAFIVVAGIGTCIGVTVGSYVFSRYKPESLGYLDENAGLQDEDDDDQQHKPASAWRPMYQYLSPVTEWPDYQRAQMINRTLQVFWPRLPNAVLTQVLPTLPGIIEQNVIKKAKVVEDIFIGKVSLLGRDSDPKVLKSIFSFGERAPKLGGIKTYESKEEEVKLEACLLWGSDCVLQVTAKIRLGPLVLYVPVELADLSLKVQVRVTLKPLVDELPCIGGVGVSLLSVPYVDFKLILFNNCDLMALPGINTLIRVVSKIALKKALLYPATLSVPLMPDFGRRPTPKGMLSVKLHKIFNLEVGGVTKPDTFVTANVRPDRILRSDTVKGSTEPEYEKSFEMVVDDFEGQQLILRLYKEGLVNSFLGQAVVPFTELRWLVDPVTQQRLKERVPVEFLAHPNTPVTFQTTLYTTTKKKKSTAAAVETEEEEEEETPFSAASAAELGDRQQFDLHPSFVSQQSLSADGSVSLPTSVSAPLSLEEQQSVGTQAAEGAAEDELTPVGAGPTAVVPKKKRSFFKKLRDSFSKTAVKTTKGAVGIVSSAAGGAVGGAANLAGDAVSMAKSAVIPKVKVIGSAYITCSFTPFASVQPPATEAGAVGATGVGRTTGAVGAASSRLTATGFQHTTAAVASVPSNSSAAAIATITKSSVARRVGPNMKGVLTVTLVRCAQLPDNSDPYVRFTLDDPTQSVEDKQISRVVYNEPSPRWNDKFDFVNISALSTLNLSVCDKVSASEVVFSLKIGAKRFADKVIGRLRIPVVDVVRNHYIRDVWSLQDVDSGIIELALSWMPIQLANDQPGQQVVGTASSPLPPVPEETFSMTSSTNTVRPAAPASPLTGFTKVTSTAVASPVASKVAATSTPTTATTSTAPVIAATSAPTASGATVTSGAAPSTAVPALVAAATSAAPVSATVSAESPKLGPVSTTGSTAAAADAVADVPETAAAANPTAITQA